VKTDQVTNEEFIRECEHTGDAGIEVEAPSRADLFACAAIGLARIMVAPDGIMPRETHTITVFGDSDDDLMHEALSDALDLFQCDGFIWRDVTVEERAGVIELKLLGEQFSRYRHLMLTELKAVTCDQLNVECADGEWKARIVFDV
jgi:SHS2 domain-containing protein